ncbi:phosphatase phospho-type [Dimargaris cristalligena]|uniref:Phosphatase phospho-type n=1 Tax=Dimargaris cristalligena TaxID=215637 RepID=A0A4Q0A2Z8_9FUNG|nr:phosphatase phospho-type [Dimargaris cristalligena]|eukprot:RKP40457.1 phosphatase phospho-type [Dimargaris cristalligena]
MPSRRLASTLAAFDFDWTLIDEDSDTFLLDTLSKPISEKFHAAVRESPWIYAINESTQALGRSGVSRARVEWALDKLQMKPAVVEMLHYIKEQGADLYVISDANTFTIEHVLKRHGVLDLFSGVVANPAEWTSMTASQPPLLTIKPYNPASGPHGCTRESVVVQGQTCTFNLCKGQVIARLIRQGGYRHTVYAGDGANDFCPSCQLNSTDFVLPRTGKTLNAILSDPDSRAQITAKVMYWSTVEDLGSVMRISLSMIAAFQEHITIHSDIIISAFPLGYTRLSRVILQIGLQV